MSRRLSRRDLLRAAPIAGAGAAAVAVGMAARAIPAGRHVTRRPVPLLPAPLRSRWKGVGTTLLRVDGDTAGETRGFLCQHGHALPEVVHSPERLRTPLVRRGDRLVETSWDEALAFVGERMAAGARPLRAEAVAFQTGWPLVRHPLDGVDSTARARLGDAERRLGGEPLRDRRTDGPGAHRGQQVPARPPPDADPGRLGREPHPQRPAARARRGPQGDRRTAGGVDPVRTELAAVATEHLAVRPGTDGALALGLIHVLVAEGLVDRAPPGPGADSGLRGALGAGRVLPAAERTAALTGVPARRRSSASRGSRGRDPDRHLVRPRGGAPRERRPDGAGDRRAGGALPPLGRAGDPPGPHPGPPGNVDGTRCPPSPRSPPPSRCPPAPGPARWAATNYPLFEMFNREAQGNVLARAILEDRPYPVRALVLVASNALVTAPGSARAPARRGAARAAGVGRPVPHRQRSPRRTWCCRRPRSPSGPREVAPPPEHEAWPDWKVVFELARAMGLGAGFRGRAGTRRSERRGWRWQRLRSSHPGSTELTGRRGGHAVGKGRARLGACSPGRVTPRSRSGQPPSLRPSAGFPLMLVTGPRTRAYINSQFRQVARIRLLEPEPVVRVHPGRGPRRGGRARPASGSRSSRHRAGWSCGSRSPPTCGRTWR